MDASIASVTGLYQAIKARLPIDASPPLKFDLGFEYTVSAKARPLLVLYPVTDRFEAVKTASTALETTASASSADKPQYIRRAGFEILCWGASFDQTEALRDLAASILRDVLGSALTFDDVSGWSQENSLTDGYKYQYTLRFAVAMKFGAGKLESSKIVNIASVTLDEREILEPGETL